MGEIKNQLYRNAITRKPGPAFSKGITTAGMGLPDWRLALDQHGAYVETLRAAGLDVTVLEADDRYPDSCFVEDAAVVIPEAAIMTRPGAQSRTGEVDLMRPVLAAFRDLYPIESPGTLEGGDVLRIEKTFFVGLTDRTNAAGIRQFSQIAARWGYAVEAVQISGMLHLKTGVTFVGGKLVMGVEQVLAHPAFREFEHLVVPPQEHYAANCLRIDTGKMIIPAGHHVTQQLLANAGVVTFALTMREFQKMDGGLTCLSLCF